MSKKRKVMLWQLHCSKYKSLVLCAPGVKRATVTPKLYLQGEAFNEGIGCSFCA